MSRDEYVAAMLQVAARDASVARVLREICGLPVAVRAGALELVGLHLRAQGARAEVLECVAALRSDDIARRVAERLGPSG
jgi:hypothetical protein